MAARNPFKRKRRRKQEGRKGSLKTVLLSSSIPLLTVLNCLLGKTIQQEKQRIVMAQDVEHSSWILDHLTHISDRLLPKPSLLCPSNCSITVWLHRACCRLLLNPESLPWTPGLSFPPCIPVREYSHRFLCALMGSCFRKVWSMCSVKEQRAENLKQMKNGKGICYRNWWPLRFLSGT